VEIINKKTAFVSIENFYSNKGWQFQSFQQACFKAIYRNENGLLNAPTGSGKTLAVWLPLLKKIADTHPKISGIKIIWITPIRALANDLQNALQQAAKDLHINWRIEARTGDTSPEQRKKQKTNPPDAIITTPESIHILFSQKNHQEYFKNIQCIVVDEWHELIGSKRGVQTELLIAHFKRFQPKLSIWFISATIGNMELTCEIIETLSPENKVAHIKADIEKKIQVHTIFPDRAEDMPWAGHLGIKLLDKILPIINSSKTTLLFTNTRAQCEIWFHELLDRQPELAGVIAMHHGSMNQELRMWVEQALHDEKLKIVVCTSSLDLGVDFRPVETIIQIGSPKGIARFIQRAGRSGHRPGETSHIYFVPTHSLEIIEVAALKKAIIEKDLENKEPVIRAFDVLVQYMMTLACGDGFNAQQLFTEIQHTYCFKWIEKEEFDTILQFLQFGGKTLHQYNEFKKLKSENKTFTTASALLARRHRMHIGTIVSESVVPVKVMGTGMIGSVEEYFASRLKSGDVIAFTGRVIEIVSFKDMILLARNTHATPKLIPSWAGGRMPLSSKLSDQLREKLNEFATGQNSDIELQFLLPLLEIQQQRSIVPAANELLIEVLQDKEGFHLFIFPFEGRLVHEGLANLFAARLGGKNLKNYSIAMNDYGFELLTDDVIDIQPEVVLSILNEFYLFESIFEHLNTNEMAVRKFREIAQIAGLLFTGFPGKEKRTKHLQASSKLFFEVFRDYDPDNLLFKQAYEELRYLQLEESRLRTALQRMQKQNIIIKQLNKPSPFCFPIMVDRLRERITNEKLETTIEKLLKQYSKN
jgi:ATP-dependent Lhr-like helicase